MPCRSPRVHIASNILSTVTQPIGLLGLHAKGVQSMPHRLGGQLKRCCSSLPVSSDSESSRSRVGLGGGDDCHGAPQASSTASETEVALRLAKQVEDLQRVSTQLSAKVAALETVLTRTEAVAESARLVKNGSNMEAALETYERVASKLVSIAMDAFFISVMIIGLVFFATVVLTTVRLSKASG